LKLAHAIRRTLFGLPFGGLNVIHLTNGQKSCGQALGEESPRIEGVR
jgi:hypothetical protein